MTDSMILEPGDLGFIVAEPSVSEAATVANCSGIQIATGMTLKEGRHCLEREMLIASLQNHDDVIAKAALELGVSRPTLYDLLKKHDLPKN